MAKLYYIIKEGIQLKYRKYINTLYLFYIFNNILTRVKL